MSRRAKLLLTALFLVLLGIPMVYLFLSWEPENPLRFRLLEEKVVIDPDGKNCHAIVRMEVRNTSLAAVQFIWGTFTGESSAGEVIFQAAITDYIPSRGTIQMEISSVDFLTTADLRLVHPGEFHIKEGSMQYEWSSRSQAWAGTACDWLRMRLPASLVRFVPGLATLEDVIDVEITSPPSNTAFETPNQNFPIVNHK
jgi:hypothetical protein